MKKTSILSIVIGILLVSVAGYGIYSLSQPAAPAASPSPSATSSSTPSPTTPPTTAPPQTPTPKESPSPPEQTTASPNPPTTPSTTQPPASPTPTQLPTPTDPPTPTPTATPSPTPIQNVTVTITDLKGNQTVTLPVHRIGCLNGGLAEVICALGGEDKIIARTDDVVFPTSLLDKPSVGVNAAADINLEALLSLNPDLVVSSSAFSADSIAIIQAAGIPVLIENTASGDRVNTIVTNFGLILDTPEKAAEIVNNTQYYTALVQQRIANLTASEKTTFYYEFSRTWYSMTSRTNMGTVLASCGGMNIATNASVSYTSLSPEYVAEANPDVIIYSLSGTTNLTDYQTIHDELLSRTVLQEVNAIKDERVHVFYYYLGAGIRYPVGELYFAKWFYPDLFTDIDPTAIHVQLIQDYFGVPLEGTYAYP